jgi:two-component system chemotaxis sensor kinase CheA
VTDLSGRGVGMDVVKRNIEALRGQIQLTSRDGHGTTTQIRLPLTLAMIDGFLTMVGGVHYVLPLAVVAECIDVPPECLADGTAPAAPSTCAARCCPTWTWRTSTACTRNPPAGGRRSLIVVRDGAVRVGLVVDRLLGEHQTVIKPLAGIFRHLKALAGSTILGGRRGAGARPAGPGGQCHPPAGALPRRALAVQSRRPLRPHTPAPTPEGKS